MEEYERENLADILAKLMSALIAPLVWYGLYVVSESGVEFDLLTLLFGSLIVFPFIYFPVKYLTSTALTVFDNINGANNKRKLGKKYVTQLKAYDHKTVYGKYYVADYDLKLSDGRAYSKMTEDKYVIKGEGTYSADGLTGKIELLCEWVPVLCLKADKKRLSGINTEVVDRNTLRCSFSSLSVDGLSVSGFLEFYKVKDFQEKIIQNTK